MRHIYNASNGNEHIRYLTESVDMQDVALPCIAPALARQHEVLAPELQPPIGHSCGRPLYLQSANPISGLQIPELNPSLSLGSFGPRFARIKHQDVLIHVQQVAAGVGLFLGGDMNKAEALEWEEETE